MIIVRVGVVLVLVLKVGLVGFGVAVPAFGTLLHPQHPSFVGTGGADRFAGGAARDGDQVLGAGFPVEDPAHHRPDTHLLGQSQIVGHLVGDHGRVRPGPDTHAATSSTRASSGAAAWPSWARSVSEWKAKRTRTGSAMPSMTT